MALAPLYRRFATRERRNQAASIERLLVFTSKALRVDLFAGRRLKRTDGALAALGTGRCTVRRALQVT
jgi:hypothetical protein